MKELGKCRAVIALLCFTATVFSGCGNRTEAVITDGEKKVMQIYLPIKI